MLVKYDFNHRSTLDVFDAIFGGSSFDWSATHTPTSPGRVEHTDTGLSLSIDVPGLKSNDLSVTLTGRVLKIAGKVRGRDFSYSYRIGKEYDPSTLTAKLEDGVLDIGLAKAPSEVPKTIEVIVK